MSFKFSDKKAEDIRTEEALQIIRIPQTLITIKQQTGKRRYPPIKLHDFQIQELGELLDENNIFRLHFITLYCQRFLEELTKT